MGFLNKNNKVDKEIVFKKIKKVAEPKIVEEEVVEEKVVEEKEVHKYIVVKELPVQQVKETIDEEGTILHFVTIEEALTKFMNE